MEDFLVLAPAARKGLLLGLTKAAASYGTLGSLLCGLDHWRLLLVPPEEFWRVFRPFSKSAPPSASSPMEFVVEFASLRRQPSRIVNLLNFSGVLLWTRPRPALTGRYTGHASRAVPFPRPSSPQKPAWIYPRRRQRSPHLGENRPPGESELRGFSSVDLDGGASLLPGLAFPEPIQPCGSRRYFLRELAATSLLFPLPQRSGGILVQ